VNEAVRERKVTRETTAALAPGISWGRLVPVALCRFALCQAAGNHW
jgi:hypothetical protein